MKNESRQRLISKVIFSFLVSFSLLNIYFSLDPLFAQSDSPVSFTKKEIAFFKWGDGSNEFGQGYITEKDVRKDIESNTATDKKIGVVVPGKSDLKVGPVRSLITMLIDGENNIYLADSIHKRIIVVAPDGNVTKSIDKMRKGSEFDVDEFGNVFFDYIDEKEKMPNLVWVKPDGTRTEFKDNGLSWVVHGVAYNPYDRKKSVTIMSIDDTKPEKLPPRLFGGSKDPDVGGGSRGMDLFVSYKNINRHLKKINRQIDVDHVRIKIEQKDKLTSWATVLGVDDNGNVYTLCAYKNGPNLNTYYKVVEAYIDVYSPMGERLTRIPDSSCLGGYAQTVSNFAIDIKGDIFHILESEDGVHIIEWVKN